jgi:anti-sigma regulatory factor (Ser/Thr protein kinase)
MFVQPPSTRFPPRELASVADLSDVRAVFVSWLQGAGVVEDRVDDLSVVISELGANAVRETPPGAPPAAIEATIDDGTLVVEVSNEVSAASSTPSEHEWDLNDPLRTGGRGLLLVSAFVDEVDVDVVDRRLVVRCTAAL